jgi:uncharacterized protein YndB with AHSA1/START domain
MKQPSFAGPDRNAPVLVQLERRIAAPLAKVWQIHTDVARWPSWQLDISEAQIDGPFAPGSVIRWQTAGLEGVIPSAIEAVEAHARTLWGGSVQGIFGIHEWRFRADADATFVQTQESWSGAPAAADAAGMREALRQSLRRWLDFLSRAAER